VPEPSYGNKLVTYIDILGFSDLITRNQDDASKPSAVLLALRLASDEVTGVSPYPEANPEDFFHFATFSDHVVRSTDVRDPAKLADVVAWEFYRLALCQLSLASGLEDPFDPSSAPNPVLIRGGICVGKLFFLEDRRTVFGPALVRSHELESQEAIFPRIVVDRGLIRQSRELGCDTELGCHVCLGEDGAYFLDYLVSASLVNLQRFGVPESNITIQTHRRMIENEIAKDNSEKRDERTKHKHRWLALYHNRAVERLDKELRNRYKAANVLGTAASLKVSEGLLDS